MKIRRGDILYADLGVQYQGSMQAEYSLLYSVLR